MSWRSGEPVILDSERFQLCSLGPEDVTERYQDWTADPQVMGPVNRPPERRSREELVRYVRGFDNVRAFHLGIFVRASDEIIGVYSIYFDPVHCVAETNVLVGERDWWGRDVVVETRGAVLDFLFEQVGAEKVMGRPFTRNIPAVATYNAQGFRCEGILRSQVRAVDGSRLDQYLFAMLRDEWRTKRDAASQQ
jgi:RimJ/RimL family protein N-acetyltransferase